MADLAGPADRGGWGENEEEGVCWRDIDGKNLYVNSTTPFCRWRLETLFTKEPHTITWLDGLSHDDVMYDVGANIGIYSLYAAIVRGAKVYAFEPEALNFAELMKNIYLNIDKGTLEPGQIQAFPWAITDENAWGDLYLSKVQIGGSCHSAGDNLDPNLVARHDPHQQGVQMWRLDSLIGLSDFENMHQMPNPTAIKVDVDGFENRVVEGGIKTFCEVRTAILELNEALEEHREARDDLHSIGLESDDAQYEDAKRKEGPFKGTGECIFTRIIDGPKPENRHTVRGRFDTQFILDRITYADVAHSFPESPQRLTLATQESRWFVNRSFFSPADFADILLNFPRDHELRSLPETGRTKGYEERMAFIFGDDASYQGLAREEMAVFWLKFEREVVRNEDIAKALLRALKGTDEIPYTVDALLCHDLTGYSIGPHSDMEHRILSVLVYLSGRGSPTKVYAPNKPLTTAPWEHHSLEDFDTVLTIDFEPNKVFGFERTDTSFHGVEGDDNDRYVFIYNLRHAR